MALATVLEEKGFKLISIFPKKISHNAIKIINKQRISKLNSLKTPINLILYVTNNCNARCDHCFYWKQLNSKTKELSLEEIENIARTLKHPLRTLILTGGEPYLRSDLKEIINVFYTHNKTKRITTPTNGLNTEKIISTAKEVLETHPKLYFHVQISLDGPENIHDKFRNVPLSYKKATETLKRLLELKKEKNNLEVSIMTTICTNNFNFIPEFVKEIKTNFPNALHKFNFLRDSQIGTYRLPKEITSNLEKAEGKTECISIEDLKKLVQETINPEVAKHNDKHWQNFQRLKWEYSIQLLSNKQRILKCTANKTFAVIYPNGDVAVCEPSKPFANLKDYNFNFKELWNSKEAREMRKKLETCDCIHPCNLLDSMSYDTNTLIKILEL